MPAVALDEAIYDAAGLPMASLRGLIYALPISTALWASIIAAAQLIF